MKQNAILIFDLEIPKNPQQDPVDIHFHAPGFNLSNPFDKWLMLKVLKDFIKNQEGKEGENEKKQKGNNA